jgi:hypothetical protein
MVGGSRVGYQTVTARRVVRAPVLTLGTIALLAALPALVDPGFLGWFELPVAQRLVFHLPSPWRSQRAVSLC